MRSRLIPLVLCLLPITMAASCPARPTQPAASIIDRHTPDELAKAGRKGPACWQIVVKHISSGQLEYLCVSMDAWKNYPVGHAYP